MTGAVGVVGLGVVGGTIAAAFREAGIAVRPYDRYLGTGRPEDLEPCSVVFLCLPTPSGTGGDSDLSALLNAVAEIEPHLADGAVLAVKSTVPPGTTDRLADAHPRLEFVSVPEFLVQARPMETFRRPDRIVIGARSGEAAATVADLLSRVCAAAPVLVVSPVEAELIKLCSNAMLAAKVAVANELAEVCRHFGVAWPRIQSGVGMDRRIGPDHITVTPERGFGGACLPKDLEALIAAARAAGYPAPLLRTLAEFNRSIRREAQATADGEDAAAIDSAPGESTG